MFEYPYVIITILVFGFLLAGGIGFYFSRKAIKTAGSAEFVGIRGLAAAESLFKKLSRGQDVRTAVYIDILADSARRNLSEPIVKELLSKIRIFLAEAFSLEKESVIAAGGETCFVVISAKDEADIKAAVEVLVSKITPVFIRYGAVNMAGIYFGVFSTRSGEVPFIEAINRAKKACTIAEQAEEPYAVWDAALGRALDRKIKIENSIQSEIDNNRFFLEYQPILYAETKKIVGAEVLSRLNSEEEGILSPGAFLSAVNNVGLNEKFDYYIFEKNCKWIAGCREVREKYFYTINFSRSTLCEPDFADNILRITEAYAVPYGALAVEILEDKDLSNEEKHILTENVKKLKEKGVLILLDDFGSGYTSFTDLAEFGVDIVKIDKSVTRNAETEAGLVILKNIIRTAKELGFKTLCEGVETENQLKTALGAGCDYVQGFLFYRPMPVTKLAELLEG